MLTQEIQEAHIAFTRLLGYPQYSDALQHEYVQTVLDVYGAEQIMESYEQTIAPLFDDLVDIIHEGEQRCEEEIDILREVGPPQEERYIERLEDVAYRLYETAQRVFARRVFVNLSNVIEPGAYVPIEWAVHMGEHSVESIQTQLREDLHNVIEHAMEDYMTEDAAAIFQKHALVIE